MNVIARIRTAISSAHESIEKTPYSVAIMRGNIGISDYVVSLAQLHAVHQALEEVAPNSALSDFFDDEMVRTEALKRDLKFWGIRLADLTILPETAATTQLIRNSVESNPVSLLGFIYVLEGSRMGSLVIVKPLSAAFQVTPHDGQGLDYHTDGARKTPGRLAAWKARVEQLELTTSDVDIMESAAVGLMESLTSLYAKLPTSEATPFNKLQADVA
jgi:heme oxygenase